MVSKEAIKQAAFELFAEKGYEATSTQDIADAVGLKKQSLYSHFKSKSDIFMEVLHDQSGIIKNELKNSIETNKNSSAEIFIKAIFDTLIQGLSDRHRLLFIKRIFFLYARYTFIEEFFLQFHKILKDGIYNNLSDQFKPLCDPEKFESFISYFLLTAYGYTDIMLMGEVDDVFRQSVWERFWRSSQPFCTL